MCGPVIGPLLVALAGCRVKHQNTQNTQNHSRVQYVPADWSGAKPGQKDRLGLLTSAFSSAKMKSSQPDQKGAVKPTESGICSRCNHARPRIAFLSEASLQRQRLRGNNALGGDRLLSKASTAITAHIRQINLTRWHIALGSATAVLEAQDGPKFGLHTYMLDAMHLSLVTAGGQHPLEKSWSEPTSECGEKEKLMIRQWQIAKPLGSNNTGRPPMRSLRSHLASLWCFSWSSRSVRHDRLNVGPSVARKRVGKG